MRQQVALIFGLCSVLSRATGSGHHDAARLAYQNPGPFYAPDFISPTAPLTPERGYRYVTVDTPFYHHREYAPAHWDWTDVPQLFEGSRSPVVNEVFLNPNPKTYTPSGWAYSSFLEDRNGHGPPFESRPYDPYTNRNPLYSPSIPAFTPVIPSEDALDVRPHKNPPSAQYPLRPQTPINPIFTPVSTTTIPSSTTPNIIEEQGGEYLGSVSSKSNPYFPLEPTSQPVQPIYKSAIPPVLLSSSSPNIIRGENDRVLIPRTKIDNPLYVSTSRPPLSTIPYYSTKPIHPTIRYGGGLPEFPGSVQDGIIPEGGVTQRDPYAPNDGPYFQNPSVQPKPPNRSLFNPNLISSPNIVRGESSASVSSIFSTTSLPRSIDDLSDLTSDVWNTESPIFTASE